MSNPERKHYQDLINMALTEDLGLGDITTISTIPQDSYSHAEIIAKQSGVMCGGFVAEAVFKTVDPTLEVNVKAAEGDKVDPGTILLTIEGPTGSILSAERTTLNFLGRLCGIATDTSRYVEAVAGTSAKIYDTRKTTPGWRYLEKYAVRAGGGENHRIGLWDAVLIKENHISAAGGIESAIERARKNAGPFKFLEIEVEDLEQFKEALGHSPDIIMLDNMSIEDMKEADRIRNDLNSSIELEASGNVTLETIREVALCGVDRISIGKITHSASSFDISLLLQ